MAKDQSWIADLLTGYTQVTQGGNPVPQRKTIDFPAGSVTDDPTNEVTHVTTGGGGGGGSGQTNVTLANGLNSNIATFAQPVLRAGGPTAPFSLGGFASTSAWVGGQRVLFVNTTAEPCTIVHEDTSSTTTNRINTPNGLPIVLLPRSAAVAFVYDSTVNRFLPEHTGFRYDLEYNVKDFGAKGDGVTDDTAAIQAAINFVQALSAGATLVFPPGTYIVSSTLTAGGTSPSSSTVINLAGFGGTAINSTRLKWSSSSVQPLFVLQHTYECTISDIVFDGNSEALACAQQKPFTSGVRWVRCQFVNPKQYAPWTPSTAYTAGTIITTPHAWPNKFQDQCFIFQANNSASSGGTLPTWNLTVGGTVSDGGITWTNIDFSPAAFIMGGHAVSGNGQAADSTWYDCFFSGGALASGWRLVLGSNIKDFHLNRCSFISNLVGLDASTMSGFISCVGCEFGNNQLDIRNDGGTGNISVTGWSSENSCFLLFGEVGTSGPSAVVLTSGYWVGATKVGGILGSNAPATTPIINYDGQLTLEGCSFQDTNPNNNYPYLAVSAVGTSNTASLTSRNNAYLSRVNSLAIPQTLQVFTRASGALGQPGASGNAVLPGNTSFFVNYLLSGTIVDSQGDIFYNGASTILPRIVGSVTQSTHQQLGVVPGTVYTRVATVDTPGTIVGSYAKFEVDFNDIKNAPGLGSNTTFTLPLALIWNRTLIKRVYVDVTTPFSISGITASVGDITPNSIGTASPTSFILAKAADVATSSGNAYGCASGDLGSKLSSAVQGGFMQWGAMTYSGLPNNEAWDFTVTFSAASALSGLTAGHAVVYVVFEVFN